jgi:hypothetical protein
MHPKKGGYRTAPNQLFHNTAILTIILVLVTMIAIAIYIASRPAVAAENGLAVPYSNALELQYARPWLEAQNKPVVVYSNALELQYAQPWLDKAERLTVVTDNTQEQISLNCSSGMEMLHACKAGYGLP